MPWITRDDFSELRSKLHQRGWKFILSKFNPDGLSRTKSAFNEVEIDSANWWIIPQVKKRWNQKISGNPDKNYETYSLEKYLSGRTGLRMLSIGSGICSHEMNFAKSGQFQQIVCFDISSKLLDEASRIAKAQKLSMMEFKAQDVRNYSFSPAHYDLVLFHSSLHHFSAIEPLLKRANASLKTNGLIIINEYVGANRLLLNKAQRIQCNKLLLSLPESHRTRFRSSRIKRSISGPGSLRMLLSDPSEAANSCLIRQSLAKQFEVLEEKGFGGNLLVPVLKDIAHNFLKKSAVNTDLLHRLFAAEDQFLDTHPSDYIYGIYRKQTS